MEGLGIEEQLRSIRPLRERSASRVRERAVAASTAEDFQRLKSRGLDRLIDLHLAESPQELLALARSYSVVSLVGGGMVDVEEVERAESLEDWYLVPEAVLGFYRENMETLAAAVEAASKLQAAGVEDFQDWEDFFDLIRRLGDKSDLEAERLSKLAGRLEDCVDKAAAAANEELKRRIEQQLAHPGWNGPLAGDEPGRWHPGALRDPDERDLSGGLERGQGARQRGSGSERC